MRAEGIVRQVLRDVETTIHRARLNAVLAAVLALIHGGKVGLAALGRAIGPQSYKHGIKRIDRLLGNGHLFVELDLIYAALARYVLRSMKRPVILLDWTQAGSTMHALTAAVPMQGRAITIYSVTVPASQYTARRVEKAFMDTLQTFLSPGCRPILVGDAGFRAPWMQQVQAMGWDFVARVRGRTQVRHVNEPDWQPWKKLFGEAARVPRTLGTYCIVRHRGVTAQLVVVDRRSRSSGSNKSRNAPAMRARRSHGEPWFLATSLKLPAKQVVSLYKSRMQIELTFRDLKSHRFGWGFEDARCRSCARAAVQIMLAAVASLVVLLVGLAAETMGLRKRYQANTISKRRVLSLVALGRAVIATTDIHVPVLHKHLPFVGIP